MNMLRKGQIHGVEEGDSRKQVVFIARLFGVAVKSEKEREMVRSWSSAQIFATLSILYPRRYFTHNTCDQFLLFAYFASSAI